jgi:hypothetical protein
MGLAQREEIAHRLVEVEAGRADERSRGRTSPQPVGQDRGAGREVKNDGILEQ